MFYCNIILMILLFLYYLLLSSFSYLKLKFAKGISPLFQFIFFGLLIFIPYIFTSRGIRDVELFESVGYYSFNRIDIYYIDSNHGTYPYFPFISIIFGFIYAVSQLLGIHFLNIWRFLACSLLVLTAYLIYQILKKKTDSQAFEKTKIFILSPISLFPVVLHTHFDIWLIFFYVFFLYLLLLKKRGILAGISLGFSILAKTWSIVFLPLLIFTKPLKEQLKMSIVVFITICSVAALYIRFWHSSINRITAAVTGYVGSGNNNWGLYGIFNNFGIHFSTDFIKIYSIIIFAVAYFLIFKRRIDLIKSSEFLMLTAAVFSINWAPQYIFWLWPFVVLAENKKTIIITSILGSLYVFCAYLSIVFNIKLVTLTTILSIPIWLLLLKLWYTFARDKDLH